jgi:hypothetical protein
VPCGTSSFFRGDAGHLYFEITGNLGSEVEGGVEYYNDNSVAPYVRSTIAGGNGYLTMTNQVARYACGQNLDIMHGITYDGLMVATEVGQLPSNFDPATSWINFGLFSPSNAAWLFADAPRDMQTPGFDSAGVSTPCTACSTSEVTAIAQNGLPPGVGYSPDGSYFGVSSSQANEIHWMQTAFGEFNSTCVLATAFTDGCGFISADSSLYYAGAQYYPDNILAESNMNPLGFGPYETYEGISASQSDAAGIRRAGGAFDEPQPPKSASNPAPHPSVTPVYCLYSSYCSQ